MQNNHENKKKAAIALKKAQSHIKKILKMIDDDEYCIEIMEQILAVNGLLKSSLNQMLKNHLQTCFMEGMNTKNKKIKEKLIDEVLDVVSLSSKH